MVEQTVRPVEWVIVDDGSTDDTRAIVGRYAAEHPWIVALHRPRTGPRQNASAVMEAFYSGYEGLRTAEWDYLAKLDGDVSFAPAYFERCLEEFRADPQLGVGGGMIWNAAPGQLKAEPCPINHVRGATKIYRRSCWEAIGGLLRTPGWDTIDEVKAQMTGWKVRTFRDLEVRQHRPTGAAEGSWRNAVKDGRADYITGYLPLFMFLKCVKRLVQRPYLIGSLGLLYGFLHSYWKGLPQVDDRALITYVRKQQLRRLLLLDSIWK
jgi:glycosyltransferase involved in cell wall biosynthesis